MKILITYLLLSLPISLMAAAERGITYNPANRQIAQSNLTFNSLTTSGNTTNAGTNWFTGPIRGNGSGMTIAGNVGVGSANPLSRLHVLSGTQGDPGEHDEGTAIIEGANVTDSKAIVNIAANTAVGIDVGGSLGFAGRYRASLTDPAMFSKILGAKENTTDNNYSGYLGLFTAESGLSATEKLRITSSGNVGIGTNSPTAKLHIHSDTIRLSVAKTPTSASATGNTGDVCWDADFIYVCVAENTWKRTAIATW